MRFPCIHAAALAVLAALASAQNAFTYPVNGQLLHAGQTVDLKWTPSTQGTVSLTLRQGPADHLDPGTQIVSSIPNSGSYSWTIPQSVVEGSYYTVEIIDDANPNIYNFTPQFGINSDNTVVASTGSVSLSGMSTSMATSVATSVTNSAMTSGTSTAGSTTTDGSSTMASVTAQMAAGTAAPNAAGNLEFGGFAAAVVALGAAAIL